MSSNELTLNIDKCTTRQYVRSYIINIFLNEKEGQGKGDLSSKYKYIVKKFDTGEQVYLYRPSYLNKGMDFNIKVDGFDFFSNKVNKWGNYNRVAAPAHYHILNDLKMKKDNDLEKYSELKKQIDNIFNLKHYSDNIKFNFDKSIPTYLLLEIIKWFFIEQDITYWNYSGRNMLKQAIDEI